LDGPVPRSPWAVLCTALLWLLVAVAASFLAPNLLHLFGWRPAPLIYGLAATIALQATLLLAVFHQGRSSAFGFGPVQRHMLVAGLTLLMIAWICVYLAALIHFRLLATVITTGLPTALAMQMQNRPAVLAVRLLLIALVAPVTEELFFRGWLWTALRQSWSAWPTAVVTASIFLALHGLNGPVKVVVLIPAAVLLSLARHFGGSARASLPVHIASNVTALAFQIASVFLRAS